MTEQELKQILSIGHELRGVEFKGPGPMTDKHLFARVVRAVLGMSNRRDGGNVVVGVDEIDDQLRPTGLTDADLATWTYDDLMDKVASYADPFVELDYDVLRLDGKALVVITVHEFREVPVICRKDYPEVLRQGACYVRSRRKPETSEIPTQTEMRELLDLATEKNLGKLTHLFARFTALIADATTTASPSDDAKFDDQLRGLR